MGKSLLLTRVLALVGLATVAGGVHSLVVPVHLDREDNGFVIPGGPKLDDPAPNESAPKNPESTESNSSSEDASLEPPAQTLTNGKIDLDLASQLHERFMSGEPVLFLDARVAEEFEAGHIMGALHMPHSRLSASDGLDEMSVFASPGDGTLLVIYCTGGDCEASEDSAILLQAAGYSNIALMTDGYVEWAAAGLLIEGAGVSP